MFAITAYSSHATSTFRHTSRSSSRAHAATIVLQYGLTPINWSPKARTGTAREAPTESTSPSGDAGPPSSPFPHWEKGAFFRTPFGADAAQRPRLQLAPSSSSGRRDNLFIVSNFARRHSIASLPATSLPLFATVRIELTVDPINPKILNLSPAEQGRTAGDGDCSQSFRAFTATPTCYGLQDVG